MASAQDGRICLALHHEWAAVLPHSDDPCNASESIGLDAVAWRITEGGCAEETLIRVASPWRLTLRKGRLPDA